MQADLFTTYPDAPGWKARDTSREAAEAIAPVAGTLRERVLIEVRRLPGTPEQIAHRMRVDLLSIRPRFSELARLGLIKDSGKRGDSRGGKHAIIWQAA
jgi:hypothetical protein